MNPTQTLERKIAEPALDGTVEVNQMPVTAEQSAATEPQGFDAAEMEARLTADKQDQEALRQDQIRVGMNEANMGDDQPKPNAN